MRERITNGDSDDDVIAYVVSRYGEFVLLNPRFEMKTLLLWGAPVVLLLGWCCGHAGGCKAPDRQSDGNGTVCGRAGAAGCDLEGLISFLFRRGKRGFWLQRFSVASGDSEAIGLFPTLTKSSFYGHKSVRCVRLFLVHRLFLQSAKCQRREKALRMFQTNALHPSLKTVLKTSTVAGLAARHAVERHPRCHHPVLLPPPSRSRRRRFPVLPMWSMRCLRRWCPCVSSRAPILFPMTPATASASILAAAGWMNSPTIIR